MLISMEILGQETSLSCQKLYVRKLFNSQQRKLRMYLTPDISHTDQLTLSIRYVSPENSLPSERFLTFFELKDRSGESVAD